MHETWRNRERGAFAGDTPPPTSAFFLEPTCRTGASHPVRATATAQRRPGHGSRVTAGEASGAPTQRPWRRGRSGRGEAVSAFEGLEWPAGHRYRSVRQTRTQPRRGWPADRSCVSLQARGSVATDSGHADAPGLRASGRARDDRRATAFSATNPGRRAPPPGSSAAQARRRRQPPDAPTSTCLGRARPTGPRTPSPQTLPYRR